MKEPISSIQAARKVQEEGLLPLPSPPPIVSVHKIQAPLPFARLFNLNISHADLCVPSPRTFSITDNNFILQENIFFLLNTDFKMSF